MPSIPQSLLWISLVILWLFVLVPMLINKRDSVRRTSDVALATRVLNGSAGARLKKTRPAAGHRGDPDWQPVEDHDEYDDADDEVAEEAEPERVSRSVVVMAAKVEEAESEYLDVDIVEENSGALAAAADAEPRTDVIEIPTPTAEPTFDDVLAEETVLVTEKPVQESPAQPEVVAEEEDSAEAVEEESDDQDLVDDGTADEYEYVEDTSGLEAEADEPAVASIPDRDRRRTHQTAAAAKVAARKYKFRKRLVVTLALALVGTAVAAFTVMPTMWWACGAVGVVTVLYLAYLRRQTRIEERLRRRRQQRMARARLGVENTRDAEMDVTPSRLRRPGAVVLEIDDEDPAFEHLEYVPFSREYDLPRAAGE